MTSNIGAQYNRTSRLGFSAEADSENKASEDKVKRALREAFKPEFLDRIDECVFFSPLSKEDIFKICRRQLDELSERVLENGIRIEYDDSLVALICNTDESRGGARHLRRRITKLCERPLSEKIISGELKSGDMARLSADADGDEAIIEISSGK